MYTTAVMTIVLCAGAVAVVLAVAGGLLAYRGFVARSQGGRSQEWPSTSGVIEESAVRDVSVSGAGGQTTSEHLPYVRYSYTVNNQRYTASHISPGLLNTGRTAEQARGLADRYPIGSSVRVWYNPQDPSEAVIDQRSGGAAAGVAVGMTLLILSAVTLFLFFALALFGFIALAIR